MVVAYSSQAKRLAIVRRYPRVLVASRHMAAEYLRHGVLASRLQIAPYFPTGVSADPAAPTARPLSGIILMASRLTQLKGGHLLVPAVRLASDRLGMPLRIVIAGHGPEKQRLEALARRLGVDMQMVGWVGAVERTTLMRQADMLAVPSTWPEPFGIVGIEAGCVGLPSVGFAVGGIPEWLRSGISGELAPADPPTARGLAAALERALARVEHYHRLREGAWRTAQGYTAHAHIQLLDEAFVSAMDEKHGHFVTASAARERG
jgi:glycosyltransferase involved in cell wall biosynthesis